MTPKISVLMPVYNVEKYVGEAIESILSQTFEDFELIIVEDASTDHTYDVIAQYKDERIKVVKNKINHGTAASLNIGLSMCQTEYIARMDGDDIAKSTRFEKQIRFMKDNPEIGISGSHMELINLDGTVMKEQMKKAGNENIKIGLFLGNTSLAHPSLIIRTSILNKYHLHYDPAFQYAEDYDLYCRASQTIKFDNYPESLIQYRIHSDSVSQKFHDQQILDAQSAMYLHLRRLKLPFTLENFKTHTFLSFPPNEWDSESKDKILKWIKYLIAWNNSNNIFDKKLFADSCEKYTQNIFEKRNF